MRYRRVVIKLSGGALSGPEPVGLDAVALEHLADEVLALVELDGDALLVARPLPRHVFDIAEKGEMARIISGDSAGTEISHSALATVEP